MCAIQADACPSWKSGIYGLHGTHRRLAGLFEKTAVHHYCQHLHHFTLYNLLLPLPTTTSCYNFYYLLLLIPHHLLLNRLPGISVVIAVVRGFTPPPHLLSMYAM